MYGQRTILFVDEVHRFNKAQQDALLPWVENGTVILIGATTENPYFEVNKALVSRSRIFQLKPLVAGRPVCGSRARRWPTRSAATASCIVQHRRRRAGAPGGRGQRRCAQRAQCARAGRRDDPA